MNGPIHFIGDYFNVFNHTIAENEISKKDPFFKYYEMIKYIQGKALQGFIGFDHPRLYLITS